MPRKHQAHGPIPKDNRSPFGVPQQADADVPLEGNGAPASEQDPKRRLGSYATAGEHAIEQPGGKQAARHERHQKD